jgi:hypothetical protein
MNDSKLTYSGYKDSKTGARVPFFINGTAMYSLYNPLRDAEAFAQSFGGTSGEKFAVVFGIGSALHITELLKTIPRLRVLAVEHSQENIDFIKKDSLSAHVFSLPFVTVCSMENLTSAFLGAYIPILHGSVRVMYQQAWKNFHKEDCAIGSQIIARAVENAKSDYATQAHFGRLWHRNILLNLEFLRQKAAPCRRVDFPVHKEACVIAAGPSLDKSAQSLLLNREDKFIIASDTAYEALVKRRITPDAVVTIDGQAVSARHFLKNTQDKKQTMLFADMCCNPSVPRLFFECGQKIIFMQNRHPLAELASQYAKERGAARGFLPFISSGAGTVTVSAAALAFKSGFSRVSFFGADFAFLDGKPYARGTYLDNFFSTATRILPAETAYDALMFRGATSASPQNSRSLTTPLLLSYKRSLEELRAAENNSGKKKSFEFFEGGGMYLDGFFDWYEHELALALINSSFTKPLDNSDGILYSCLPLLAHEAARGKKPDFFLALKLAHSAIKRYDVTQ